MNELTTRDARLSEYFSAVILLHVSYRMTRSGFNENLMEILAIILGQFDDTSRYDKRRCSVLSLNKAAKLMKVVANKLISTVQLIEIELSRAYLFRALKYKDSDSDSVYCLANLYLAVLYYTAGQYQTAIDHCTLVTRSQDHSQCTSHVVQGEVLPKVDDNVDNILGLTVFYHYVLSAALNQQLQRQYVSVFTTEIFAYYLHCRLLSVTQCRQVTQMSLSDVSQRCAKYVSETDQLFIGDVLVFKSLNHDLEENVRDKSKWRKHSRPAVELAELLQRSAVKHLTTYRQLEARDFGSTATIATTDFEALYAYKHGDYQQCLQLSTRNVRTLLNAYHIMLLYTVRVVDVVVLPMFIHLMDDDIVSLTAMTLIANPRCRCKEDYNFCISQLTLSLYLMAQCQLKLRHSVTSLAQTLDYIKVVQRRLPVDCTLDQLTLKLSKCKIRAHLRMMLNNTGASDSIILLR